MTTISKGDFLVVDAGTRCLIKVKEVDGKTITGLNQKMKRDAEGKYEKRFPITVKKSEVLVNLGPSPRPGKVYGVNIEPLYKKVDTNTVGEILFFADYDEKQTSVIKKALIRTVKKLKAKRLGGVPFQVEVRNPEGKYAGWYHFLPKAEQDVLCIKPNLDMTTPADLEYVISHEYAHGIWYRMMRAENIAKWIALYDKHMALTSAEEGDLDSIYQEIVDAGSIREFQKNADEETQLVIKACLRSIRALHGVDRKHLDLLLRNGHSIEEYWPSYVEYSEKNVIVTAYGSTKPEEFFAEAFAHWFVGKKLPKEVEKLLIRSLAQLSKGRINSENEEETTDHDAD